MFGKDHSALSHSSDMMIQRSFIAAVLLTTVTAAAVVDKEPPVLSCPSDILIDDLTESEVRVTWNRPLVTDNSGVPPELTSNLVPGDIFSVPGSYEVVYTAVDGSYNVAKCTFRITLKRKPCILYPAPINGALACLNVSGGKVCAVMCKSGFDFVFTPPWFYICVSGSWSFFPPFGAQFSVSLPWPDCSVSGSSLKMISISPNYYFDAKDPKVIEVIKTQFHSLVSSPFVRPLFCPNELQCSAENIDVFVGKATG